MDRKRVLIAIGGNSIIKDRTHLRVEDQYKAICETTSSIVDIIEEGHQVVITHGNGPQVGFILRRSELANRVEKMHSVPLVNCDADTQGALGYQIQQALYNELKRRNIDREAVTVITQILVDKCDHAFKNPSKPIGQFYSKKDYHALKKSHPDWILTEDAGRGYRRVVPSPNPVKIIELNAIKSLFNSGFIVIAAGGGGIPVIEESRKLKGIDSVIDKDNASSLLATLLDIDTFIISTGVSHVHVNYKTPIERALNNTSIEEIIRYKDEGHFEKGSMLPKIEAALTFLENGGNEVIITNPENLYEALKKRTGTHIKSSKSEESI